MTDKQIIIDGVDVNGCEKQGETIAGITCGNGERIRLANEIITKHKLCKDNPNCVYKQLKAKEQECESLGHTYLETNELLQDKTKALTNLKSENDGLKTMLKDLSYENQKFCYQIEEQTKQLEPFKDEYFKGLDNIAIAELAKKSIRITAENSKLEQTLAEIKEICNSVENIENINSLYDAKLSGMYLQAHKILQKISEVE